MNPVSYMLIIPVLYCIEFNSIFIYIPVCFYK